MNAGVLEIISEIIDNQRCIKEDNYFLKRRGMTDMQQLTVQNKIKPWMGFVLFAVVMVLFFFVGAPMQDAWGIIGLVATEIMFLVLAIAYALIFRIPLKEMFPVKRFKSKDFFGSLSLTLGGTLFGLISVAVVGIVFPKSLEGSDVEAISDYIGGGAGYIFLMFAMSFMPAVCEEAIHRGAILSSFRSIRKDWVIVLIMAMFFGIFHLSTLRFINTAIMGACLTYIVVKKNNILLSSLSHFIINFSASTLSYVSGKMSGGSVNTASALSSPDMMKAALGTYLMTGIAAPFLIVLGLMLLNPASHKKIRFLFAGIVTTVMLISSIIITLSSSTGANVVAQTNISYTVESENTESLPIVFEAETESNYTVAVVVMNAEGEYSVRIETNDGEPVVNGTVSSGMIRTYTRQIRLEPGFYNLYVENGPGTKNEKPAISIQINKT